MQEPKYAWLCLPLAVCEFFGFQQAKQSLGRRDRAPH